MLKPALKTLTASALVFAALEQVHAQYTPPPPPAPFKGFINEYLATNHPSMSAWDFGGEWRERFVAYEGYAIGGKAGSVDFRGHGVDVNNEYLLSRIRFHGGYTAKWWGAYAEGQSSLELNDERA